MKYKSIVLSLCVVALVLFGDATRDKEEGCYLVLKSVEHPLTASPLSSASYLKASGFEMVRYGAYSADNGRTWLTSMPKPDFDGKLPYGYRRGKQPLFVDSGNERVLCIINAMDIPDLDPKTVEPQIQNEVLYLRYRVSVDSGKTYLFDDPIMQKDKTPENPFDGIYRGKTGFFIGDGAGARPIQTLRGDILIPVQTSRLGPDGKLINPGGGWTWTEVVIFIGQWVQDNRIEWRCSEPIVADPARSTRGMIEPTLAEMPDGRILCVMRGSNGGKRDPNCKLPSYRWFAVSIDGGIHWSKPEPMTYEDGTPFFRPPAPRFS